MPDKKFTDFTLKSPLVTGDFVVGYRADGSEEWRAYIKDILALQVFPQVTGVFGRNGNVAGASGDYTATNITNDSLVDAPTVKDALNSLKQAVEATGTATLNSVSSVFGRQGAVVGQSGDYNATGVTSNVVAPTVHAALVSLESRLEATGALSSAPVTHVFGRQGSVAATSGDYSGEYITNTSNVVGATVTNALNTLNTRLGSTGSSLFQRDSEISGYLYFLQTGFSAEVNTRLLATGQAIPSVPVASVFGRIGTVVGQSGDYLDTGVTNTSNVFGPTVKDALDTLHSRIESTGSNSLARDTSISGALNHYLTGLDYRLEQTGSATVNTVASVFGRQGAVVGQSGDYRDTGVTNTSNVAGGTVFDALNSLNTRLGQTGALASAPVISVFGREGAVVGQSGDYSDTGVTNTSTIVGSTVKDVFETIQARLLATGQAIPDVSDVVRTGDASAKPWNWVIDEDNFASDLDTKVPTQQSTKAFVESSSPVLVRTGDGSTASYRWVLDEDNMASDSATRLPTQQSVKAYIDSVAPLLVRTGDSNVKNNAWVVDEDNMSSNLDTKVPTQQSVKAYIDAASGELSVRLGATGENLAPVSSVFGRVGAVVGQSGDYRDTGVTNTSSVAGGTVKDALDSLNTRLQSTGSTTLNTVTSVFGRQGAVVGQSGDYSATGITNTSSVAGDTVHHALDSLSVRLGSTGSLLFDRDITVSGALNFAITGLDFRLGQTGALAVLKSNYNSGSLLFGNVAGTPVNVVLPHFSVFGRQGADGVSIGKPSAAELLAGTETDLRAWSPQDVKAILNHSITGVQYQLEQTGIATTNTVASVFGRQGAVVGQSGDYRDTGVTNTSSVVGPTVKDALNTLDSRLTSSGAMGGGGGDGKAMKETHTQASHGFSIGNAIRWTGAWGKAKADSEDTADVLGIVESVTANDFTIVYGGRIASTGLALTPNLGYYLSAATAGAITGVEPDYTNVSKPVLYSTSATGGLVIIERGLVGAPNSGDDTIHFAVAAEKTALAVGTGVYQMLMEYGLYLNEVVGYTNDEPAGANIQFDINMSGASIFSTVPTIDAGELATYTAATQPVITGRFLPSGERIKVDIDQVGSTIPGTGLKIILRGTKL